MAQPTDADIEQFATLSRAQVFALSRDFMQPPEVQRKALDAVVAFRNDDLRAAISDFQSATARFSRITRILMEITEAARRDPVGDAVGMLTPTIRRAGELMAGIADIPSERPVRTDEHPDQPVADPTHVPTPGAVPPAGTAINSKSFSVVADEYVAMFNAAAIHPNRTSVIDRQRARLVSHQGEYEAIGRTMSIPWHIIGLIHSMESNLNFGTHLHNGDTLAHRTVNHPPNRPPVPDPPFAWSTSAIDALQIQGLQLVGSWPLSRQLFELERYNGFGYRFRGLATPYLWSFCDRYVKGRFVRDRVFDPESVSKQIGAAVLLKAMIDAGDVARPSD